MGVWGEGGGGNNAVLNVAIKSRVRLDSFMPCISGMVRVVSTRHVT
jgi:hypothetical protein